ncbi:MAG: IS200/IS605 family transposase [Candidatus Cloacimonetes bacterium]|nr:IS200/IS605 family transposase [Candidatus Cloacimonadota bacterium]MBS3768314.1 IS200/IS605 family transposase [Candidatus Cloacimonadota bacterium]
MSKTSMKICWLHLIWTTKNRYPYFQEKRVIKQIYQIFKQICLKNDIYYKACFINPEHVHLLVDLPVNLTIQRMVQFLKGISSYTINQKSLFKTRFCWAKRYACFSVSRREKLKVVKYINNQREHHKKESFTEEWKRYASRIKVVESKNKQSP